MADLFDGQPELRLQDRPPPRNVLLEQATYQTPEWRLGVWFVILVSLVIDVSLVWMIAKCIFGDS